MFSEVFRHRNHFNKQVELAQSEAIAASAEVTRRNRALDRDEPNATLLGLRSIGNWEKICA